MLRLLFFVVFSFVCFVFIYSLAVAPPNLCLIMMLMNSVEVANWRASSHSIKGMKRDARDYWLRVLLHVSPISQCVLLNPGAQVQLYPFFPSKQRP